MVLVHDVKPVATAVGGFEDAHRSNSRIPHPRLVGVVRRRQVLGNIVAVSCAACPVGARGVQEELLVVEELLPNLLDLHRPPVHPEANATEGAEPDSSIHERSRHAIHEDVVDGAAPRDARQEGTDEWSPRDPPAPVEDRPPVHPLLVGTKSVCRPAFPDLELPESVREEAYLEKVLHVVAQRLHHEIHQVPGPVHEEDDDQEKVSQVEGRLGQNLHSDVDTGDNGHGGDHSDAHYQN
mmetsp:Transcript_46091/g.142571  ORF Transcript_46091/g.142571 Transcript_46091/m.142571 type:complete len:238 (-) Transcript_46091:499-1212(-)